MISVVLAVYNGREYIKEQLQSIIEQTYQDVEIVIVDDCSTDNTLLVIENILNTRNIINYRIIENQTNIGPTKSFEKGILECRGEYIAFCDQDDIWFKNKLEMYLGVAKSTRADIIYSPSFVLKKGRITGDIFPKNTKYKSLFSALIHNSARGATMMVKNNFINELVPFYDLYDKWIYTASVLCGVTAIIETPLHYYRIHENNYNAGNYRLNDKHKLIGKINNDITLYKMLLLYASCHKNTNKFYSHNDIINSINDIISFYSETIACLNSRDKINCLLKYLLNIVGREFSNTEKIIYLYYYIFKYK